MSYKIIDGEGKVYGEFRYEVVAREKAIRLKKIHLEKLEVIKI